MSVKVLFLCLVVSLLFLPLEGAYLRNVPVKVQQPSGEVLKVYASGDEFYNWLHDKDGYTIIQDPTSGYYVYAISKNGELLPSNYVVAKEDIQNRWATDQLEIPKNLKHALGKRKSPQMLFPEGSPANKEKIIQAPLAGQLNNIVIFIRFSDESEFSELISTYDSIYNAASTGANSMRNYFDEASYHKLLVSTTFYPQSATNVVSYQDAQTRAYYRPYNAATNPIGYQTSTERRDREHVLLKNAVDTVSTQIPSGLVVDGDDDGRVDNVCFIVYGGPGGWSDLLWPHMWSLYSQYAYINGKRVYTYNFQLQTSLGSSGVGVLCHEMFHSLGAPDLYHYSFDGLHPVYTWGLMEYNSNPPRHMGSYMKYRYGEWISSIPEITSSGTYSLNPLESSSDSCFRIASPFSSTEFFLVEYRKKNGTFGGALPGEGLLVYRINFGRDGLGNRDGPPDEVYIYRPNGTPSQDGNPTSANFSADVGRISINDATNPGSFLSDGNPGGLNISNITSVGSTISFDVGLPAVESYQLAVLSVPQAGIDIVVTPNDINSDGDGTTDFSRYYSPDTDVNLTAPVTSGSLEFLKWVIEGVDYSASRTALVTMDDHKTISVVYGIELGESLDNHGLNWTTGGTSGWYGQADVYYYDSDAAQSPELADNQSSSLQTTIQGPGFLTFYWKVSSEEEFDFLELHVDGAPSDSISGERNWEQKSIPIGSGSHLIEWIFDKDGNVSEGLDCGWVDLVEFSDSPEIVLGRKQLNYGAVISAEVTSQQKVLISSSGSSTLDWISTPSHSWVTASPGSGTGSAMLDVGVNPIGLGPGTYMGSVSISSPDAVNSPQVISVALNVLPANSTQPPIGYWDTPINGTTQVRGQIPVTGWALDDIEVDRVEIWRRAEPEDLPEAINSEGLAPVGTALFVEGARPNLETDFPYNQYPWSHKGGWGYMLLTYGLPRRGNGTYVLHAFVWDVEGKKTALGTKAITCDNDNAVKPFGTIDTPAPGMVFPHDLYGNINFGWVLTPQPKTIPFDGSSIYVYIDGVLKGNLAEYGNYSSSVATLFPGYQNTNNSYGHYFIDMASYETGVHSIQWTAYDSDGVGEGIGSRYFNIDNTSSNMSSQGAVGTKRKSGKIYRSTADLSLFQTVSSKPVGLRRGYAIDSKLRQIYPAKNGDVKIMLKELDRIEIHLTDLKSSVCGYMVVGNELHSLPVGSTLEPENGIFYWQLGAGFVGEYELVFVGVNSQRVKQKIEISVNIRPKF